MKNISTGFGLCVLGLGIAAWPVLDRVAPVANASAVTSMAAAAGTAAIGQSGPTIVWYGVSSPVHAGGITPIFGVVFRAWSDGRIEYRLYFPSGPGTSTGECNLYYGSSTGCGWRVFSDPAEGYTFRSDLNFDEQVKGADLATLLNDWGAAPRNDIPPSECPLALINP